MTVYTHKAAAPQLPLRQPLYAKSLGNCIKTNIPIESMLALKRLHGFFSRRLMNHLEVSL